MAQVQMLQSRCKFQRRIDCRQQIVGKIGRMQTIPLESRTIVTTTMGYDVLYTFNGTIATDLRQIRSHSLNADDPLYRNALNLQHFKTTEFRHIDHSVKVVILEVGHT